jgi:hypothetical protein
MNRQGFERFMHMNWPNCSQSDYDRCYELWRLAINAAAQDGPATARSGEACGNALVKPSCAAAPESAQPPPGSALLVATVLRGGTEQFGYATVLRGWEDGASKLPLGEHKLYAAAPGSAPSVVDDGTLLRFLNVLHRNVPEDERPMSMSDLSDEQAARVRDAIATLYAAAPGSVPLAPADLLQALADLSFECDGVTRTEAPSRETYNRTFAVLQKYRALYAHPLDAPADSSNSSLEDKTALRGKGMPPPLHGTEPLHLHGMTCLCSACMHDK